ncbi:hypothetical protein [Marinicauda sp. Alg238-R41]|uniref:hypothetical protein n=1 Tax=Marinicauda sp. Alg238-R41 TaxID=2993447 RepID=UPI0022DFC90B|nr:hypothetical protein [Marinicauda sp. Alg238-R41]
MSLYNYIIIVSISAYFIVLSIALLRAEVPIDASALLGAALGAALSGGVAVFLFGASERKQEVNAKANLLASEQFIIVIQSKMAHFRCFLDKELDDIPSIVPDILIRNAGIQSSINCEKLLDWAPNVAQLSLPSSKYIIEFYHGFNAYREALHSVVMLYSQSDKSLSKTEATLRYVMGTLDEVGEFLCEKGANVSRASGSSSSDLERSWKDLVENTRKTVNRS